MFADKAQKDARSTAIVKSCQGEGVVQVHILFYGRGLRCLYHSTCVVGTNLNGALLYSFLGSCALRIRNSASSRGSAHLRKPPWLHVIRRDNLLKAFCAQLASNDGRQDRLVPFTHKINKTAYCWFIQEPRHGSGGKPPTSCRGEPVSIPGQSK
jgi:hypothetical protein